MLDGLMKAGLSQTQANYALVGGNLIATGSDVAAARGRSFNVSSNPKTEGIAGGSSEPWFSTLCNPPNRARLVAGLRRLWQHSLAKALDIRSFMSLARRCQVQRWIKYHLGRSIAVSDMGCNGALARWGNQDSQKVIFRNNDRLSCV